MSFAIGQSDNFGLILRQSIENRSIIADLNRYLNHSFKATFLNSNSIGNFTIAAEILARSLANFYRQYADRHMNLKFVRRVSERERAIRPFVIVKNKLMSVFKMNFVITLSK